MKDARDGGGDAYGWAAGDVHNRLVRDIAVHIDADVAAREIIVVVAMDADAIERQSKCVHGARVDQVGVADGSGLRQIVKAALGGRQNVLGEAESGRLEISSGHIAPEKRLLLN